MLKLLFSLLAGATLTFAFSPFNIYTLAFISPAILLFIWLRCSSKQAFLNGLFFGLGLFGTGTSWIFISINTYGNTPTGISILVTSLFVLILALYFAFQGLLFRCFKNKTFALQCLFIFPAIWVLFEFLRSTLFTGFPWLLLGYSQMVTPLHGLAPLFGVYGLSLAITLISGCLTLLALRQTQIGLKITCVVIMAISIGGGWLASKHHWTKPFKKPIKTSLIQGNIAQSLKWQPQELVNTLRIYKNLTAKNLSSKIIIWPEGAIPTTLQSVKSFIDSINTMTLKNKNYIISGIPIAKNKPQKLYNGLILFGNSHGEYLKRHLVPFGEYFPLKSLFSWFTSRFQIPMSNFSAGPLEQPTLKLGKLAIAPFICYEVAFPRLVLNSVKNKHLIIVISDDSWFGQSIALAQQLQMSQMRALETGRPALLATNSGVTAFINPLGQITQIAPINKRLVLTGLVTPMQGNTPLMLWHYYPILGVVILFLLLGIIL